MIKLERTAPRRVTRTPRAMDDMFEHLWRTAWGNTPARYNSDTAQPVIRPAMDVIENEHSVVVRMDLPGLAAEDVHVEVDGDILTISGAFDKAQEQDGERYHVRERANGAFKRSLRLANTVDAAHIEAAFASGVLTLTLPKRPEAQPRRIEVHTN